MKFENYMILEFPSKSTNEAFARSAVACFAAQLDLTLEELGDIKTAVSEAVTNCIVHAYANEKNGRILIECRMEQTEKGGVLHIEIRDFGCGIEDVERAVQPFYTTLPNDERSGMGFTIMQTFMDEFSLSSSRGEGTKVRMSRYILAKENAEYCRQPKETREGFNA